jgi:hypothetical protein
VIAVGIVTSVVALACLVCTVAAGWNLRTPRAAEPDPALA